MEFNTKKSKGDILDTLICFKKDIFDKTITDTQLMELADKFAKYAFFIVASDNGSDVGYVAFYCNDTVRKNAFISMIIVDSKHQGHGYGKSLLTKAIEVARDADMSSVKLEVSKENSNAIAFYHKLGFEVVNEDHTKYTLEKII